jgi:large conductance mechanosensitive channel
MDPTDKVKAPDPIDTVRSLAATRKAFTLLEEFKHFALKGNVIDLAVGVVIGAAFGKIVTSLVDNILMPLLSTVMPTNQSYTDWAFVLNGKAVPYGKFLGDVVSFLVIAFALFVFIQKFLGFVLRVRKAEAVAPPPLTRDQELLTEIRDLLRKERIG